MKPDQLIANGQGRCDQLWSSLKPCVDSVGDIAKTWPEDSIVHTIAVLVWTELLLRIGEDGLAEAEARGEAEVQALAPRLNEPSHGDIRSAVLGFVAASAAMAKSVDKILAEAEDLPRGELWFISDEIREVEQNLNATAAKFSAFVADSI